MADYVLQQEDEADSRGLQLARDIAQVPPRHIVHMHPAACRADMHLPSCSMQAGKSFFCIYETQRHSCPSLSFVCSSRVYGRRGSVSVELFQGAPIALRMAKASIDHGMDVDLHTAYALEHSYYSQVFAYPQLTQHSHILCAVQTSTRKQRARSA